MLFYIAVFAGTAIASLILTRFTRDHAIRCGWLDRPDAGRHHHAAAVPRIGGVAIYLTFILAVAVALSTSRIWNLEARASATEAIGIVFPASLVFLLGLCDDRILLGPYAKLGVQAIAAVWLYRDGFGIHLFAAKFASDGLRIPVELAVTVLWVVLITNAFNLIDGLDGLSAGSALLSTIIVFGISLCRDTPIVTLLSVILAAALLGFLRLNFYPASIFLGDCGSLFIGFMLSALALASSQKQISVTTLAIPVIAFGLPVLDVCISVARRFMNGKPLFLGDGDHVHHKLIKRGFSHREAVLVLYTVAAAFGILSLALLDGKMRFGFVLIPIGAGAWLGIRQLKYPEVQELDAAARQMKRKRRIVANNLGVRRAIEQFTEDNLDCEDICRILRGALENAGFCAASLSVSEIDWMDEAVRFPLIFDAFGRWSHFWAGTDLPTPQWELKLELTTSAGRKFGDLYLFRELASEALPVDIDLLGKEFRAAVSGAIDRTVRRMPMLKDTHKQADGVLAMKVKSVGS